MFCLKFCKKCKKVITFLLCVSLIFSLISVNFAKENTASGSNIEFVEEIIKESKVSENEYIASGSNVDENLDEEEDGNENIDDVFKEEPETDNFDMISSSSDTDEDLSEGEEENEFENDTNLSTPSNVEEFQKATQSDINNFTDELIISTSSKIALFGAARGSEVWYKVDGTTLYLSNSDGGGYTMNYDYNVINSSTRRNITKVVIDNPIAPAGRTGCRGWFQNYINLDTISNIDYFDTSNVADMSHMFHDCRELTDLDLSNFDTSNVTDMSYMFASCEKLTNITIDPLKFNTSSVKNMRSMFSNCYALTSIDVSSFNTTKVKYMTGMFRNCTNINSIDVSSFNTVNVKFIGSMFYNCSSLNSLDISNFVISSDADCFEMLSNMSNLTTINISESVSNKIDEMLYEGTWKNTATSIEYPLSPTYNVTIPKNQAGEYQRTAHTFYKIYYYISGDTLHLSDDATLSNYNAGNYLNENKLDIGSVLSTATKVVVDNEIKPTHTIASWFDGCSSLTDIDLSKMNTENVKDMSNLFYDCQGLTNLDISGFDTNNVNDMNGMFGYCENLTSLDLRHFTTSKVEDMAMMFEGCSNLDNIDLTGFVTSNVVDFTDMFLDCSNLQTIKVDANFKINTSLAGDLIGNDMFEGCDSLIGGSGTSYTDKETSDPDYYSTGKYARIDSSSTPGYFTKGTALTKYTVSFNSNSGTSVSSMQVLSGKKISTPSNVTKAHYILDGWYRNSQLTNKWDFNNDAVDNNVTLYAKWVGETFNVTLNANGGTINSGNIISYQYGIGATLPTDVNPPVAISTHSLAGWYDNNAFTGNKVLLITKTDFGDKNYYAKYAIAHNITFNANGGSGVMNPQKVFEGEVTIINANAFSKSGYSFVGWDDGNGNTYSNKGSINNITSDITLSAKWKENTSNSGSSNGGSSSSGGSVSGPIPAVTNNNQQTPEKQITSKNTPNTANTYNSTQATWNFDVVTNTWKLQVKNEFGFNTNVTSGFAKMTKTEKQKINGVEVEVPVTEMYCFDENGNMLTGWVQTQDKGWYYFDTAKETLGLGAQNGWKFIDNKFYYFDKDGKMLINTVSPDGHTIGSDGAAIN